MKYSFLNLAKDVLTASSIPLSVNQIWEEAGKMNLIERVGSSGKTPVQTLSASLYTDIKNREDSIFVSHGSRPVKFFIKGKTADLAAFEEQEEKETKVNEKFSERELHKFLSTFVQSNPHFRCYTKTIYHEKSNKREKGYNEWLHPDLVGVYFPFENYQAGTMDLLNVIKENACKIFSFEMKIDFKFINVREYFFQAVSNSSWAHEGYLVALDIDPDIAFMNELQRLSKAFGIGVIKLNPEFVTQSEVLFSARKNEQLDRETVDRLVTENPNFREFISEVGNDSSCSCVRGRYDELFQDDEEAELYAREKGIIEN